MFTPKTIYERQIEKDPLKINCALVLDPGHVILGAEDGLMICDCAEEVLLRLGERKVTYLERCDNLVVYMGMAKYYQLFITVLINHRSKKSLSMCHTLRPSSWSQTRS